MILNTLRQCETIEELNNKIKEFIDSNKEKDYLPALISIGEFSVDSGEDFYLKLVIASDSLKIDDTWLIRNFVYGLDMMRNDEILENVIVTRTYKDNKLYVLNPLLTARFILNEEDPQNAEYVPQFYNNSLANEKGKLVIKSSEDFKILVLKDIIKQILDSDKCKVIAEYEYRSHYSKIKLNDINNVAGEDCYCDIISDNMGIRVLGSLEVQLGEILNENINILVYSMQSGTFRENNPFNYNDDTDAGLVIFDYEAINELKKRFLFYGLNMLDKINTHNSYLVDLLPKKIVFWEGEYNKLPTDVKESINNFNITDTEGGIISPAMSSSQLMGDFDYVKKMTPYQKFGDFIMNNYKEITVEKDLNFIIPSTWDEFQKFIFEIEDITGKKLQLIRRKDEVDIIKAIKDENFDLLNDDEIERVFQGYCNKYVERLSK